MCRYGSSAWRFETWRTCTNQKPAPSEGACTVEFIQSLVLRPLGLIQHAFSQNAVRPSLISLAALLQPRDHICVEAHGDSLLHWAIEPAPDSMFPGGRRKFRNVRSIDLIITNRSQVRELSLLLRGKSLR